MRKVNSILITIILCLFYNLANALPVVKVDRLVIDNNKAISIIDENREQAEHYLHLVSSAMDLGLLEESAENFLYVQDNNKINFETSESNLISTETEQYVLTGVVSDVQIQKNSEEIRNSGRFSSSYQVDLSVDFTLLNGSGKHVDSFVVIAHAGQVKITLDQNQVVKYNTSMLFNQLGEYLASDVTMHLNNKFNDIYNTEFKMANESNLNLSESNLVYK